MDELNLSEAARGYLQSWRSEDQAATKVLSSEAVSYDERECCAALQEISVAYQVARSLPLKPEQPRLINAFQRLISYPKPSSDDEVFKTVRRYTKDLFGFYERLAQSAATKFLWMRFKSPIVIYDSRAARWLSRKDKTLELGYDCYLEVWRSEFSKYRVQIIYECRKLPDEGVQLGKMQWFQERVFDRALWDAGAKQDEK